MRVALVLRSAEVQPLFRDLCTALALPILPLPHTPLLLHHYTPLLLSLPSPPRHKAKQPSRV